MKNINLIEKVVTYRCKFRLTDNNDIDDVYEILSSPNVICNLNMDIHKKREDTKKLLENYNTEFKKGTKLPLAIIDKKENEFIGVFLIKLDLYNEDSFEATVYLKEKFWGLGIYSEILPAMIRFAFEVVDTENFRGYVMDKNISSSKGFERNGFMLEKVFEVPKIEGKIRSYLMTRNMYKKQEIK
ncbi:MAG: GNAT family N-acetyltransferase [Clostridia bacterium]|nr:GNAT family N-acetyltransferase [Clostridia bacterium]